ncbi:hypothetical protein [Marinicella marina]|uniref:hypothetical protein n=1 Tax=Marinicella marina TaxID=2996016 RepID=UPI0024BCE5A8|nr:hypothetical protein [Marinicella marina]MDJ1139616.1 hypothetical protein [Marinicella marina]
MSNYKRTKALATKQGKQDKQNGHEPTPEALEHSAWFKWYMQGYNSIKEVTKP